MKRTAVLVFIVVLFVVAATAISQEDSADAPALSPQQEFLKQLVGEWDASFKTYMQPDEPPMEAAGSESVRALGDHWILAEMKSTMMGEPIGGILSVGYNAQKEHFNGTWIDTMSGHLWLYKGELNEAGDTLTLHTKGPSMQDLDKTARYREVITVKSEDHRTFSSNMELSDGTWMTILEAEFTRK